MKGPRIEYGKAEVKKWGKLLAGLSMKEKVKITGIGEGSLRNALIHSWGSEQTREKLNKSLG